MSSSGHTKKSVGQGIPLPAPADWSTDFEQRQTVDSGLPYEEFTGALEISPSDPQQYRLLRLPNNMVVLCIQNNDTLQSSACLSLHAGSMANPPEFLGMAHFCEHLLTMGSKKYPSEKEYAQYLTSNAGYSNAETSMYDTKYFFKVSDKAFEGGLDRFAQIFIDPLFNASSVERELNAVQSEFNGLTSNDMWRAFMISKRLCNPNHPFSRFCVGTIDTLQGEAERRGADLRAEMIKFYEQYYSSDIMRLVVYSSHSLDQLTEWAVSKFSAVASKGDTKVKLPGHLLTKTEVGKLIRIQTVASTRRIRLEFPVENPHPWFRVKPFAYLTSLLTHGGPGALVQYLKVRGLAHGIESDLISEVRFCDNILAIDIMASEEGMEHWQDVVRAVFAYIQVLQKAGPQKWFYDEISVSREAKFKFKETEFAMHIVTSLADHLQDEYVAPSNAASTQVQLREFNAPLIAHYTDMLNPDNMRVILVQQDFDIELPETEPYMGAAYRTDAIPSELLDDLHGELVYEGLYMPGRNKFIPKNLEVQRPAVLPLWFKRDDQFFLPRGDITLNIEVPKLGRSPRMTVMGYIYEYIALAGVYYSIDMGYEGIYLTVYGLSDKLPLLLDTVLKALKSTKVDQKLLDAAKVLHLDHFKNKLNDSASVYAAREIQYMSYTPDWMPKAILREIDSITVDKIQEFADTLFDSSRIKMLVVGNHSEQEALDIGDMVIDSLGCTPLPQHLRTARQTHWIEAGFIPASNSAVNLRIYMRDLPDIKSQAMGPLLSQIIQLRTKEQLGYSLDAIATVSSEFELMGESNPAYLLLRIRQDELTRCIEALAESWIEKKRNQTQEGTSFWSCIMSGYYMFDVDERYAESLKSVTRDDLDRIPVQDCTEIAVQVWSPKLPMPATEDVARYPATAIALHQCLQQDNATELSLDAVHRLVDGIAASSDEPFDTLLARCVDMAKRGIEDGFSSKTLADIDAMSSRLSEPGSRVRTALAMAVEHAAATARRTNGFVKGHSRLRISEFGDFRNIGMLPSPDNVWVVPDSLAFKNAQTLLGLPVPAQRLVPKYQ
ncbi:hypothetical protein DL89DRAFT_270291 [Linderina pennispora]|uniref:LuxS/MPP-like metallohydrolase n=1 Tax=Linderina pennispora TaxID=61395 RepID=A0A1Y1VYP8_9FUNG|nr:uncharacterized protein DL89DRAFT_270291 [Linderina pennispora]ORX66383.1 hypothetical protein DL89DRAFT_270291 [Linderina pennispora]